MTDLEQATALINNARQSPLKIILCVRPKKRSKFGERVGEVMYGQSCSMSVELKREFPNPRYNRLGKVLQIIASEAVIAFEVARKKFSNLCDRMPLSSTLATNKSISHEEKI